MNPVGLCSGSFLQAGSRGAGDRGESPIWKPLLRCPERSMVGSHPESSCLQRNRAMGDVGQHGQLCCAVS